MAEAGDVVKRQPVAPDPVAELDALINEILTMHERMYHPGTHCLENTDGKCFDAFGGTPSPHDFWVAKDDPYGLRPIPGWLR